MDESVYIAICEYLKKEWIVPSGKSNRQFALDHNIDESAVRKILGDKVYRIEIETLRLICESKEVKLADFFNEIGF